MRGTERDDEVVYGCIRKVYVHAITCTAVVLHHTLSVLIVGVDVVVETRTAS